MTTDEMIAEFKQKLPGWWFTLGDCSVSCHASCAPDRQWCDADLLKTHTAIFDPGFHADIDQPSTLAEALRDAMEQGLEARAAALAATSVI